MTTLEGTFNSDFLIGTLNDDIIVAFAGNDTIQGLEGNDIINGNPGLDLLFGQQGSDTIYGGQGSDTLYGGKGNDWLMGNLGTDFLSGGAGDDFFGLSQQDALSGGGTVAAADTITDFGNGNDRIILTNGMKITDLVIASDNGNTTLQDRLTGNYLAVLSGVTNVDASDFVALQQGINLGQALPLAAQTNLSGQKIDLEVARTSQEQMIGLMYRADLADHQGMVFPIVPARAVKLIMKDVFINLDMVFLQNGQVQEIISQVPPCSSDPCPLYGPNTPVDQVIELRGGKAAALGLKVGDRVDVSFLPGI